uniref:transglutaminase-like domain-containing protein n=1 Tax=Pararhizobium sp. IMCC3301 TaxID=3067904 RepID=UPI0027420996|nr:transglutaminase family protein [Pararhizobium sp. IMCC3301]
MTRLKIDVNLHYGLSQTTDILSQIRVADMADQVVSSESVALPDTIHTADVAAENGIGVRTWIRVAEDFRCDYSCIVAIDRPALDIARLDAVPPHLLPGDTVRYLMPSRYCPSDEFQSFVAADFGHLSGGRRVDTMRQWLFDKFRYASGSSNAQTTALDTFVQRQGVCRDFAHVLIALCRASAIPARFVSAYAPDVMPQDFHAVVEVYLDGTWHLIDPTNMSNATNIARIGVGSDAAEVAFLSAFAPITLQTQQVSVTRL